MRVHHPTSEVGCRICFTHAPTIDNPLSLSLSLSRILGSGHPDSEEVITDDQPQPRCAHDVREGVERRADSDGVDSRVFESTSRKTRARYLRVAWLDFFVTSLRIESPWAKAQGFTLGQA